MTKKTILLLAVFACLTLACICAPSQLLPIIEYNIEYYITTAEPYTAPLPDSHAPSSDPEPFSPSVQADDSTYTGDISTCIRNLEDTLYEAENASRSGDEFDAEYTLVTFDVSGDSISNPEYASVPSDVAQYQRDTSSYQDIWDFVVDVIPADQRANVTQFMLYTDGVSGSLGAVEQTDDPHYWILELDGVDAAYFPELSTTLVHEIAHILTLNDEQVTTNFEVFYNPDDMYVYDEAVSTCDTYFLFEGCANPDSYMAVFVDRFWQEIYYEWDEINYIESDSAYEDALDAFYQNYADQFVSSYAATSPEEDIVESFMYFIFSESNGYTIADEKIEFFYEYPELMNLRDRILANLCTYVE